MVEEVRFIFSFPFVVFLCLFIYFSNCGSVVLFVIDSDKGERVRDLHSCHSVCCLDVWMILYFDSVFV